MPEPRSFPTELLRQPVAERLTYFRSKTIGHPHLVAAYELVRQAIEEPAGAALIIVCGPTGVGKTMLRLRLQQKMAEAMRTELEADPGRLAVVGVEAVADESGFRWRDFYRRGLVAMAEPLIDHKIVPVSHAGAGILRGRLSVSERAAAPELRHALEQALRHRRPAAFLIDEAQHLNKVAGGRRLLDQLDTLKSLASMTGVVHVLFGTYDLLTLTNLSGQLNRRTIDIHFPRYRVVRPEELQAFKNVILSFQAHLPVERAPDLVGRWEDIYERSVGNVGVLKDWFMRALSVALENGGKSLTLGHLDARALSRTKLLQMAREMKEGEERVTDTTQTATELRLTLGMAAPVPATTPGAVSQFAQASQSEGRGRPAKRRVGERCPVRDPVGVAPPAG